VNLFPEQNPFQADFPLFARGRFDFTGPQSQFALRTSSNPELQRRIVAASVSITLAIGLQYAYKEYTNAEDYPFDYSPRRDKRIEKLVENITVEVTRALGRQANEERPISATVSDFALQKAVSVLDVAHTLAHQGSLLEAAVLCRSSIEKLSLAISVCKDPKFENPYSVSSTKSILIAKKHVAIIGPLYGLLSNLAHWDGSMHTAFLTDVDGRAAVLVTSSRHKAIALILVCLTAITLNDGGQFVLSTTKPEATLAIEPSVRSRLIEEASQTLVILTSVDDAFDTTKLLDRLASLLRGLSADLT
jgi:hypothetical protein